LTRSYEKVPFTSYPLNLSDFYLKFFITLLKKVLSKILSFQKFVKKNAGLIKVAKEFNAFTATHFHCELNQGMGSGKKAKKPTPYSYNLSILKANVSAISSFLLFSHQLDLTLSSKRTSEEPQRVCLTHI
jgi:hypothetical protein